MAHDIFAERDDDWSYRAILDYNRGSWLRYASGYRQAANVVVAALADEGRAYGVPVYPDAVAFPVAFCYRHYVELMLKALVIEASRLLGKSEWPRTIHDVSKLWSEDVRPRLEAVSPKENFDSVEAMIDQFHSLDPSGEEFRFPFKQEGRGKRKSMKPSLQQIAGLNLLRLKEIVDELGPMLEGAFDYLDSLDAAR